MFYNIGVFLLLNIHMANCCSSLVTIEQRHYRNAIFLGLWHLTAQALYKAPILLKGKGRYFTIVLLVEIWPQLLGSLLGGVLISRKFVLFIFRDQFEDSLRKTKHKTTMASVIFVKDWKLNPPDNSLKKDDTVSCTASLLIHILYSHHIRSCT